MRRLACIAASLCLCACAGPEQAPPLPPPVPVVGEVPGEVDYTQGFTALLGTQEAYTLGVGDVVGIGILNLEVEGEMLELEIEVAPDGRVAVPVLGQVLAEGQTPAALRTTIVAELGARFLQDPYVVVKVKEYRARRIGVLGGVNSPGIHYLPHDKVTVNEALALAGGLGQGASLHAVVVHGGDRPSQREIDLEALARGDVTQNAILEHGDVLHVLPLEQFTVAGFVNEPGQYTFRDNMTVRRAVALAKGVIDPDCSPDMTRIRRRGPEGEYFIPVDLYGIIDDEIPDVAILPGDVLELRQSSLRYWGLGTYRVVLQVANLTFNALRLF